MSTAGTVPSARSCLTSRTAKWVSCWPGALTLFVHPLIKGDPGDRQEVEDLGILGRHDDALTSVPRGLVRDAFFRAGSRLRVSSTERVCRDGECHDQLLGVAGKSKEVG